MTISQLYNHPSITAAYGKGRTYHVISHLRDVWSGFLEGELPSHKKPINQYSTAWLLFILSNCKTHKREDVVKAIKRGAELKDEKGQPFVVDFGDLLGNPEGIKDSIKSVSIFYDADNMAIIEHENGTKFIYHGKGPAYKIRRAAVLEKDFLVEIAQLIHEQVVKEDQEDWDSQGDGFSPED